MLGSPFGVAAMGLAANPLTAASAYGNPNALSAAQAQAQALAGLTGRGLNG